MKLTATLVVFLAGYAGATTPAKCPALGEKGPCVFSAGGWKYELDPFSCDGTRTKGGKTLKFHAGPKATDSIERLSFGEFEGDLILLMQAVDPDEPVARVQRLDGKTLAEKWSLTIEGFNLSEGLIQAGHLYVSAAGFVSKVNLNTGKFVWSHGNLYDQKKSSFGAFETPRLEKGIAVFQEEIGSQAYKTPLAIRVDDKTGKLLR